MNLRRISEFSLDRFEVILVRFERALYFFVTRVVHLVVLLKSGILAQ